MFPYKKVLLIGATSGIGARLADVLVENGVFVIAVGRRRDRLDAFVAKHGQDKVDGTVLDIVKLEDIPSFADKVMQKHPDIDCVFLNSGIQRGFDFARPSTVDLSILQQEFITNYIAHVHLTKFLLPHLQAVSAKGKDTALIFTTSQLALVPLRRSANYSASKAATHAFVMCLREQVALESPRVRIIEVYPPAVQTEMHDTVHQPDLKNGRLIGMPLDEFVGELWEKLERGDKQIPIGTAKPMFEAFEEKRQAYSKEFNDGLVEVLKDFTA